MKLLITGNCGYVGSVLTKKALEEGHKVIGYDSLMHGEHTMNNFEQNPNLKIIKGDIREKEKLSPLIKESDIVIHLAAIARVDNPLHLEKEIEEVNRDASIEIAKLCKLHNKRMIFASTCSVYGLINEQEQADEKSSHAPTTIYARTKSEAEKGIIESKADAVICRFATAYGPSPRMRYDLFINEITRDAFMRKKIELFDPNVWRCYIHTEDMAKAILFLIKREDIKKGIFNIGSTEQNTNKQQIVELIKKQVGDFQTKVLRDKRDPRNYKILFGKIESEGFKAEKSISDGIKEMLSLLSQSSEDPYNERFTNYK